MNRNIIEENGQIPELYWLRHKHDVVIQEHGYDYNSNLLKQTLSPVMLKNNNTDYFYDKLNDMFVSIWDSIQPIRNLFYYTHNKYYNCHGK